MKKILVPTDFSDSSDAALQYATSLARDSNAVLLIVHVKQPSANYDSAFGGFDVQPNDAAIYKRLERVTPPISSVAHTHKMLAGDTATEIVRFANDENVDMIVLGTHGRSGLNRLLMGSVAESVVRRATCPVLTVKQPTNVNLHAEAL